MKDELLAAGASVVGYGDVREAVTMSDDIAHLGHAVTVGLNRNLNEGTVGALKALQRRALEWLKGHGYRYLVIPPDSDRSREKFVSRLYPLFCHKTAATCAGLGWIGKNGLVINPVYGPKLSFAAVLTDAPLPLDEPVLAERCGGCSLCVEHCPSGALTGSRWSRDDPFVTLIDLERCMAQKSKSRRTDAKPNCGLCITVCPYGRKMTLEKENDEEIQGELSALGKKG